MQPNPNNSDLSEKTVKVLQRILAAHPEIRPAVTFGSLAQAQPVRKATSTWRSMPVGH